MKKSGVIRQTEKLVGNTATFRHVLLYVLYYLKKLRKIAKKILLMRCISINLSEFPILSKRPTVTINAGRSRHRTAAKFPKLKVEPHASDGLQVIIWTIIFAETRILTPKVRGVSYLITHKIMSTVMFLIAQRVLRLIRRILRS